MNNHHSKPRRTLLRHAHVPDDTDLVDGVVAACLEALGQNALDQGQHARAGRLLQAAKMLARVEHEDEVGDLYSGPVPRLTSVVRGRSLVPHALLGADEMAPLPDRQREVAVLIARGYTNRQIAMHLAISERTAGTHVQNILGKLGLNSRAQVASWVASQTHAP